MTVDNIFFGKAFEYAVRNVDKKFHRAEYLSVAGKTLSCYSICQMLGAEMPEESQMNTYNLSTCINSIQLGTPNESPTLSTYQLKQYSDIPNADGHAYKTSLLRMIELSSADLLNSIEIASKAKLKTASNNSFDSLIDALKQILKSANVKTRLYKADDNFTEKYAIDDLTEINIDLSSDVVKLCIGTAISKISKSAFKKNADSLETIVIPNQVKNIEFGAFVKCKNLKNIVLIEKQSEDITYLNLLLEAKNASIYCEDCRIKCLDNSKQYPADIRCVMSDIHLNIVSDIGGAKQDLKRSLEMIQKRKNIKNISICGDIGTNGYSGVPRIDEMNQFKTTLENEGLGLSVDFCCGNHDCLYTDQVWNQLFGHDKNYYVVNQDRAYVYLSLYSNNTTLPYNVEWLSNLLNGELSDKKIFLFMHYPMTTGSTLSQYAGICTTTLNIAKRTYDGFTSLTLNNQLLELFKSHGNIIVFSGHSHYAFEISDFLAKLNLYKFENEDNVTLVHVPSLAYPRNRDGTANGINRGNPLNLPSLCYILNIYDDVVLIKCLDTSRYCPSDSGLIYSAYSYIVNI